MSQYAFRECSNPMCALRLPIDLDVHAGKHCPRCGGSLMPADASMGNRAYALESLPPVRPLSVILDNIRSAHNVGAIFRTAEGLGIDQLYLCGITPTPTHASRIAKTALGAEQTVPWSYHPNAVNLVKKLRSEKGIHLVALEWDASALPVTQAIHQLPPDAPVGLIVGHERAGVDPEVVRLADLVVYLPMVGSKESYNVSVAFGMAAAWLLWEPARHR